MKTFVGPIACCAVLLTSLILSFGCRAQSLSDQIEAVASVQQRERQVQVQAAIAMQSERDQAAAEYRAREAAADRAARQVEHQHQAARAAAAKMAAGERHRDQSYQDGLRELELQRQQIQVDTLKARSARENDYIDRELKQQDAVADVTKSLADVNRNLSIGLKDKLESEGQADIRKASGVAH